MKIKYLIEYQFGKGYRHYVCEDYYKLEMIIKFMKEVWNLEAQSIKPILETEEKRRI